MSDKFFFKGRKTPKPKHESYGFNTKRSQKSGTDQHPLNLSVVSDERKAEIEAILEQHELVANIEVNADTLENIIELDGILNKPITTRFEKTPNRNDPCSCGSGKKYKKCCG
ncbi:SWIM/SEC-C metal-binding motif protein, PBPRA1643 family [Shewanella psychrophila]|uniref:SWIM/SEC-C metal-binding motif protein, PBPRA1643 family n=1 Tax=Shewanella psychrophila TaxID=225848 RepID=A0A1S6HUL2_9GAMM|nr:PBPRA1643 family SWIM/SEC-C metal-binding motif protein [Shewanella psychrophila]AQS39191.1 SWIM/SEC-C metal-binding motif protein, PBPRA1643 family [Shewanella psychrophila]